MEAFFLGEPNFRFEAHSKKAPMPFNKAMTLSLLAKPELGFLNSKKGRLLFKQSVLFALFSGLKNSGVARLDVYSPLAMKLVDQAFSCFKAKSARCDFYRIIEPI